MFRVTGPSPAFARDAHEALANDMRIVTRFTVQQSFRNEHIDCRFG
jgi:hypothetical protein